MDDLMGAQSITNVLSVVVVTVDYAIPNLISTAYSTANTTPLVYASGVVQDSVMFSTYRPQMVVSKVVSAPPVDYSVPMYLSPCVQLSA